MAEIELLSTGPVNYDALIDIDIESEWTAAQTSVYQRIEFDVTDPSALVVARPADAIRRRFCRLFEWPADCRRQGTRGGRPTTRMPRPSRTTPKSWCLTNSLLRQYLDELVAGTNVLAIHGLNIDDASPDMLLVPELVATALVDESLIETYFVSPTPGAANDLVGATVGPIVRNVTENPPQPTPTEDLVITAEVVEDGRADWRGDARLSRDVRQRKLHADERQWHRWRRDGGGWDLHGQSPLERLRGWADGPLVRHGLRHVRCRFTIAALSSTHQFAGVLWDRRARHSVSSSLPVFEYFVENVSAAATRSGTRASVFFLGEFYDNVFIRHRGGNTTHGRKFEFNDGHHFRFDPSLPRVDEINLNEKGAEPTYMRQVLSWDVYAAAGQPASLSAAWHTRRNGQFLDVRIFVEQPDADLLRVPASIPTGRFTRSGRGGGKLSYLFHGRRQQTNAKG